MSSSLVLSNIQITLKRKNFANLFDHEDGRLSSSMSITAVAYATVQTLLPELGSSWEGIS